MRQITIQSLQHETFAPFGMYAQMNQPEGYALTGALHAFYPDRVQVPATGSLYGFSTITVNRPPRMVIDQVEYHTTTGELILGLNDDMVLHVAPPSGGIPVPQHTCAFLVPRLTLIYLRPAVWHLAPLPANAPQLTAMIALPVCTYANDCTVCELDEQDRFELVFPRQD